MANLRPSSASTQQGNRSGGETSVWRSSTWEGGWVSRKPSAIWGRLLKKMLSLHNRVWDILTGYIHQVLEEMKGEETDEKKNPEKIISFTGFQQMRKWLPRLLSQGVTQVREVCLELLPTVHKAIQSQPSAHIPVHHDPVYLSKLLARISHFYTWSCCCLRVKCAHKPRVCDVMWFLEICRQEIAIHHHPWLHSKY